MIAAIAVLASLLFIPTFRAAAEPPPNPSDQQLSAAAQEKAALADQIGQLGAQVAEIQNQLEQKKAVAELAEQKYAYAVQLLGEANAAAKAAKSHEQKAQRSLNSLRQEFRAYTQSSYMDGDLGSASGSLLTADDPNAMLEASAVRDFIADHQLLLIERVQAATIAKSNADAAARRAVEAQRQATAAADDARQQAEDAVVAAQAQEQQLQATLSQTQGELSTAQERLATLNNQRAEYIQYQKHQAYLRHLAYVKHQQELARARALEAERARQAAEQARREREQREHDRNHGNGGGSSNGGGGSSSGGGSSGGPSHPPAAGGGWTAAKGEAAVARARRYLGWMYAWAGGNAYGPTRGVCTGGGAWNDCNVTGFDCSGLTLYAWAPYTYLDHFSVSQFSSAGSYHPSVGALRPGDLVFWSANGSTSGIHHVAIYEGGGMVIQAPQSGSVIQETALGSVSWGYYGATRPLT